MVTSNSMLANPTSSPSVSFLLAIRLFMVIPYICEMHCPANVIMMVAVVLALNRHQCIANHHRDPYSISGFTSSHQHNMHIPLRPLNNQYLREVGSSATCCWQWVRLLTRILPYHRFMLSTHHIHSYHYDSTLIDKIIVFETNFVSSLAILQHSFSFWQQNLARLNYDSAFVTASIFLFQVYAACDILL